MTDSTKQTQPVVSAAEKSSPESPQPWLEELTPRQIVAELDRYIVGQDAAKKAVAIAVRNRWRRAQAPEEIRDEILPNNIILIGPTGVGKTEIARRLARLSGAPFIKVEASKFTEVGYVGRDVESMVRDLVDNAVNMVRSEREDEVFPTAEDRVEERILDLLLPPPLPAPSPPPAATGTPTDPVEDGGSSDVRPLFVVSSGGEIEAQEHPKQKEEIAGAEMARYKRTRDKLRVLLRDGKLEDREIEVEVTQPGFQILDFMQP
ncbi:MAG: AAA family ATPase, partial [Gemmatimonadetes bacterium]|nr:AAA family ATPase [Gemmatimonadota bacterium]